MTTLLMEFLRDAKNYELKEEIGNYSIIVRKPFICPDGLDISIQCSKAHHCTPKENLEGNAVINYTAAEIMVEGYEHLEEKYGSGIKDIYYDVPIEVIEQIISEHMTPKKEELSYEISSTNKEDKVIEND